jgi:pimeloyl-ACP methyl ester carboxylesterase
MTTKGADSPVVESFATGADGTRLYVRKAPRRIAIAPQGAAEPPLAGDLPPARPVVSVFSDGILCDGFIWKYLWEAVADRMPVAHWHYRGHGRSGIPVDPNAIDIQAHARDLDAVRRHIGDPDVVLFGHSMGCQVALEGYRVRPEKVRAIVLLCGSYGRVTETFHGTRVLAQVLPKIIDKVLAVPELARAVWSRIPPEMALKIALMTGEIDQKTIRPEDMLPYLQHLTHVDFPMFLRMLRAAGEHTAEDLLPDIHVPVLLVAGEKDAFTPPYLAEEMKARIPGADLLLVSGGTHVAPLEQRELVNLRIDKFLRDHVLS